jgi:hypothetical protein
MNEKIFTSTKLVQQSNPLFGWTSFNFMKTLDSFVTSTGSDLYRVFRDGTIVKIGTGANAMLKIGRTNGTLAYWDYWSGHAFAAFELFGGPDPNTRLNPNFTETLSISCKYIDDINQVFLEAHHNLIKVRDMNDGSLIAEIPVIFGGAGDSVHWVQEGRVAVLFKATGAVVIVDYLSSDPQVISTGNLDPFVVGAYDCAFKLFVTIGADSKIRIYTGDVLPTDFSNPVFDPLTITGINSNRVSVRLTGTQGEPLAKWWVNWSLEGVGGEIIGRLDKYGSVTDEDGYAHNIYIGPDDGITGFCKIKIQAEI